LLQGEKILQALADADLLLMPSAIQESFGMSALEALAAGVPILTSEGIPIGRWAEEAGAGLVVPCRSQDFARATRDLLSQPAQLQKMGERGRRLVKERFDLPVVARQMLAQFKAIITTGKPLPY
jgi:glycosyltransferase involved in cell wall biosynthesis